MTCYLLAHSHLDSFFFFSLSLYTFFEDVLSWTDEKFQAENRGFQELHERQWKNWHYVLAKHKVRDATSKHLPCKVPQSLQFSQHTLLPTAHTCQWAIQRIKTKGVPFLNTFIQKHKLIFFSQMFLEPFGNTSFTSNQVWKIWQAKWDLLLLRLNLQQLIFIHQSIMDYNKETGWNGHISMNDFFLLFYNRVYWEIQDFWVS